MDIPVRFAGRVRQLGEGASRLTRHRLSLPVGGKKIIHPVQSGRVRARIAPLTHIFHGHQRIHPPGGGCAEFFL